MSPSSRPLRLVLAALLFAPAVSAAPGAAPPAKQGPRPAKTALLAPPSSAHRKLGRSIGSPTEGHLVGGAHLAEAPHLRIVPQYAQGDVRWGLESLVGMLDRAARMVRKQYPGAVLSVGHLSRSGGGEIDRHASHESGRDADVGFYVTNHIGKPVHADHFVPFLGDGTAKSWPGARFDDARNWALVAALVGDGHATVTHIFVATPLRARLLAYAAKIGAPAILRQRAAAVMAQPRGALPHDDHFHVRIACPAGMDACIEQPVARRRARPSGTVVADARGAARTAGAGARTASAPVAKSPATGHAAGAPPARPPSAPAKPGVTKPAPRGDDDATARSDASDTLFPTLGPIVPGLDSAVIAAPLGNAKREPPSPDDVPAEKAVDDPDGVLE